MFYWFAGKKKSFIAKCLFFRKNFFFISAELIQLLSLVFKMEIFDRSAGLLLDLSFLILPINVTCTWESIYFKRKRKKEKSYLLFKIDQHHFSVCSNEPSELNFTSQWCASSFVQKRANWARAEVTTRSVPLSQMNPSPRFQASSSL